MAGLLDSKRWEVLSTDEQAERELVRTLGVTPLVARVLVARGFREVAAASRFLTPSLERDWADPLDIPGMLEAADRVELALARGERIAVFGDFDVDGMTATCLLTLGLRRLGGEVYPYIPHRFGEGYGLSREALTRVKEGCDPSLIITVDNGIAAGEEVKWLLARGVDVVITDHHEPGTLVPEGIPVTDPKLSETCYSRELAGAGVALKLVCELGRRLGQPDLWREYTEVATLGTISDMMLLEGENRALVTDGMERMRHTDRPGIVALAATAGVDLNTLSADELPFSLVPRLNAAGRMGTTDIAFDLLMADNPADAQVLAARLEQVNTDRRDTESALADEALAKVAATYRGERVVIAYGEGWHEGVKGIVASRLVSRYHVPCILFSVSDGVAHGSGRSVGSVDLFHAVEECSDLLVRFGGHAGAVGVTCEEENLEPLRERLIKIMSALPAEEFEQKGEIAAIVSLNELTCAGIGALDVLQPFGQGNKKPLFGVRGVCMRNRAKVGGAGNHLRFIATDGSNSVASIMFRTPDIDRAVMCEEAVDLVFDAVNETWQGRTKPKLMVRDIIYHVADEPVEEAAPQQQAADFVEELFAHAEETLRRGDYAHIAEAANFFTKAVGVTFAGRQAVVAKLAPGEELVVRRVPDNPADENAVGLFTTSGEQVGYLRRQIALELAPLMDAGTAHYVARVSEVTGGSDGRSLGVNVELTRTDLGRNGETVDQKAARELRESLSKLSPAALTEALRAAMIGEHALLPAQQAALDQLAQGRSTLAVMATGRGKSLIFHVHAARVALHDHKASVFVYPLRALVSDQAFHLAESFERLGMSVRVLTGETTPDDRGEVFAALASGALDVVLTTPEFLAIHADRFAQGGRVGFVVIDEAHHAGTAKGGNRSSYMELPRVLAALGSPTALAVTATASDEVAREICRLLSIHPDAVVIDRSVRANLAIRDQRELRDRDVALVTTVATGEKCVVYVNSREQSISLARMLRRSIPELAQRIAFYNAGLTREDRARVEEAFRAGELCCIVSTSAFGEGVNLPDIRRVVLYHMPFGRVEFNQMSGRAGRDGRPSEVVLLFGARDARINERVIASSAPGRPELVTLYRTLRSLAQRALEAGESSLHMTNADIASATIDVDFRSTIDDTAVSCGVSVFRELGFLSTTGYGVARQITMVASPPRVDLDESIRFAEGQRSREEFSAFRDWALEAPADEMLASVNRPITPSFGRVVDE